MRLTLTENDFSAALDKATIAELRRRGRPARHLAEGPTAASKRERVLECLPRVLTDKIRRILPDDFVIKEVTLDVAVSGTVFGSGVSGTASVTFCPSKALSA